MFLLAFERMEGDVDQNVDTMWSLICDWYSTNACTAEYTSMELKYFVNPSNPRRSYPKLKGRGAQVKSLVAPLLQLWNRFHHRRDAFDRKVLECLESF